MSAESEGPNPPFSLRWQLWRAGCLALLLAAPPLVNAGSDAGAGDLLHFLDGAAMHGAFKGMEAGRGLRWQHPDAKDPFDLQPAHLDFVRFAQAQSVAMSPTCHFRFAGGDNLFGSLVSLDDQSLEFNTWFGGTMKIPRAAIQTVTFLPANYTIVYEGPSDASGWLIGGSQQGRVVLRGGGFGGNVVVMGGGVIFQGGRSIITSNPTGAPYWAYRDGSFVSTGAGALGRDFHLSGSSTLEFDLACAGSFNLLLDLYSPTLDHIDFSSSSFLVELDSGQTALRRTRSVSVPSDLGSVILPGFDKPGKAHITVHCNRQEDSMTLLMDGEVINRWTDLGGFKGGGSGIIFQNQGAGSVQLSNIRVSQWEGMFEPDITAGAATNADAVSFLNHDKAGGKVQSITEGKLNLLVGGSLLHVPAGRVRRIDFAQSSAATELRGPWEVRAVFPGGGSVSFQLDKWDDKSVSGRSALFGSLAFQPASIREIEFNLDRPKENPAPTLENEFEALDQ